MKKIMSFVSAFVMLGGLVLSPTLALATLGEPADSVAADSKALAAVQGSTTAYSGYTVKVVQSDANTVREYIAPSGIVFAIAWNGYVHPDLAKLLGAYAGGYSQALKQSPLRPGSRRHQVKTGRLVVEKWGHMRNLQGRAYDPSLLPAGVSREDIK
ncbi:MAG: DUF2844 domain-containing protein [Geobacteraceae bacterium]|nr:DUF2844 domain-containing protein [Geobacteraceae bacterium]